MKEGMLLNYLQKAKTDNFEEWKQFHLREIINAARISDSHTNVVRYYDAYTWTEVKYNSYICYF